MIEVNIKEARSRLSALLDKVNHGEKVIVTRHGRKIACLVPPERTGSLLSLKDFREKIRVKGENLSETVIKGRKRERY